MLSSSDSALASLLLLLPLLLSAAQPLERSRGDGEIRGLEQGEGSRRRCCGKGSGSSGSSGGIIIIICEICIVVFKVSRVRPGRRRPSRRVSGLRHECVLARGAWIPIFALFWRGRTSISSYREHRAPKLLVPSLNLDLETLWGKNKKQKKQALAELDYPERFRKLLLTPQREIHAELVISMDDGEVGAFSCYR